MNPCLVIKNFAAGRKPSCFNAAESSLSALTVLCLTTSCFANASQGEWPVYLGDKSRSHYSPLDQIKPRNVNRLEPAWIYRSGDAGKDNLTQIQCNPIIVDGVLYATTPQLKLVALNAGNGREKWRFDPYQAEARGGVVGVNRGVV